MAHSPGVSFKPGADIYREKREMNKLHLIDSYSACGKAEELIMTSP